MLFEKTGFEVVQIKFLSMHITNQKYVLIYLQWYIYKISSQNMLFS